MYKFLLISFFLFPFFCSAQQLDIAWSEKNKDVNLEAQLRGVISENNSVTIISNERKRNYAHIISDQMQVSKQAELDLDKKEDPIALVKGENTNYLLTNEFDKRDNVAIKRIYSMGKNSVSVGKKLLEQQVYYDGKSSISLNGTEFFNRIEESFDKQWIAQITENKVKKKENTSVSIFTAHKGDEVKSYANNFTLPYADRDFKITDAMIANDGTVSIVGYLSSDDNKEYDSTVVFTIDNELKGGEKKIFKLPENEGKSKFIGDMKIVPTKLDYIVLGGFYNRGGKFLTASNTQSMGSITYVLDKNRETVFSLTNNFNEDDLAIINSDPEDSDRKKKREKKTSNRNLTLLEVIPSNTSSGFYLISEQVYKYVISSGNYGAIGGATSQTPYTDFGNLVITYVEDQQVKWNKVIAKDYKSLVGHHDYLTQYFYLNGKDMLFYTAQADKEELEEEDIESKSLRNIALFATELSAEKALDPEVIAGGKEIIAMPLPNNFIQLNDGEIIVFGREAQGGVAKLLFGDKQRGNSHVGKITYK